MVNFVLNEEYARLASDEEIARTVKALTAHGMETSVVETGDQARARVLELIPPGAEVYNAVSRTLELVGLAEDIEKSARFQPVRSRVRALDRVTQQRDIRRLTASPDVLVGSVHAITEEGQVMLASAMGTAQRTLLAGGFYRGNRRGQRPTGGHRPSWHASAGRSDG